MVLPALSPQSSTAVCYLSKAVKQCHDIKHCSLKFRDFSVDLRNQVLYLLQQKGHAVYSVTLQSTVCSQSSERRAMKCCVAFAQCNTAVTRPSLKNSQKEAKQCCPPSTSKPSNADFYPKCKFCPIQFLPQNDMDIGHQLAASI